MIWFAAFILSAITGLVLLGPLLPLSDTRHKLWASLGLVGFIAAALGIYTLTGNAALTRPGALTSVADIPQPTITEPDIQAMVAGLSARLEDTPEDPEGWTRLIRSYIVLGDTTGLIEAHKTMSEVYSDRPEIAARISKESGFNELAARVRAQQSD